MWQLIKIEKYDLAGLKQIINYLNEKGLVILFSVYHIETQHVNQIKINRLTGNKFEWFDLEGFLKMMNPMFCEEDYLTIQKSLFELF